MWKGNTSLSKLLLGFFAFIAGAVLILLVCMDWYLIKTYQMAQRDSKAALLESSANTIRTDMERLSDAIYDFYENNQNFAALVAANSELEEYNYAYELDVALKGRSLLEDGLDGYFLYYGSDQNVRYHVNTERVDIDDVEPIKGCVQKRRGAINTNWKWTFAQIGNTKYGFLMVSKQNVSLCFVYDLSRRETSMQSEIADDSSLFILDVGGTFAASKTEQELRNALLAEKEAGVYSARWGRNEISARRIGNTDLWLCMQVPTTLLYYISLPQLLLVVITVIALIGVIALYKRIRSGLVAPLEKLVETMNRISEGEWEAKIEADTQFEEIKKVDEALEAMMIEIKKQKLLAYEQTIEKQQTQLRFLQLQLKPHFYLNGLKTLNALVLDGERQKMQELIINLSEHLRYLLQAEREIVSLQSEIAYVKNYTELQKNMTGRPFSVVWELPPDAERWRVPTLCIQTFVENSFKYAKLGNAQKELLLRISAMELETEDGRFLDLCIRDNGCGYDPCVLREINERPNAENVVADTVGIGIRNLQRRCELHYGARVEYNFYNEDGAVSELILPWCEKEEYENFDRG